MGFTRTSVRAVFTQYMATSAAPPAAAQRVGKYMVGAVIGSGSFGQVREAVHTITGERVAIKILALARIKDMNLTEQVQREISNLKRLSHRNVMRLHGVLKNARHLFLVCEMVRGGDLFDQLHLGSQQGLCEHDAQALFRQIVEGVAYCHSQGVSHRDLKPENILLTRDRVVKITDFGFCNTFTNSRAEERELTTTCGTPNYIAPEMTLFQSYNGRAVDVWSCGVMLYQLVSGMLPFEDSDTSALFRAIRTAQYDMPDYFSHELKDLVRHILIPNPAERLTVEGIVTHPWMTKNPMALDTQKHTQSRAAFRTRRTAADTRPAARASQLETFEVSALTNAVRRS